MAPHSPTTAYRIMQPVRAMLGTHQSIREASARLARHEADAAPVIGRRGTVGVVSHRQLCQAVALELGDESVGILVTGSPPIVNAETGLQRMKSALRGTAPALLVRRGRVLVGVVTRQRLGGLKAPSEVARRVSGRGRVFCRSGVLPRLASLARKERVGLYLVGGVVRDLLLGRTPKDLDLVVEGDGPGFALKAAEVLEGRVIQHSPFGTAVITRDDGSRLDVATARREIYPFPASLPVVEPATIHEDLSRRDVTINSIAMRLHSPGSGTLLDDLGGVRDLRKRVLRIHHAASIIEDPTRAYRIARFAARFDATLAPETRRGLQLAIEGKAFDRLSGDRLYREFRNVANEPDPASVLIQLARWNLLEPLGPAICWDAATRVAVRRLVKRVRPPRPGLESSSPALLILMLMSRHATPGQRAKTAARLGLRGRERKAFLSFAGSLRRFSRLKVGKPARPSRLVRACEEAGSDVLLLTRCLGGSDLSRFVDSYLERLRLVQPALSGKDLKAMGLAPGPAIGQILERLRRARLDGEVSTLEQEKTMAARLARRHGTLR